METNFEFSFPFEEWRKQYLESIFQKVSITRGRTLKEEEISEIMARILDLGMDAIDRVCDTLLTGRKNSSLNGLEQLSLESFLETQFNFQKKIIGEFLFDDFLFGYFDLESYEIDEETVDNLRNVNFPKDSLKSKKSKAKKPKKEKKKEKETDDEKKKKKKKK